jgi:hypothetical protein
MGLDSTATSAPHNNAQAVYEIQVEEELDQTWEGWLDGLAIRPAPAGAQPTARDDRARTACTLLTGTVADQSALRGMLCRLWDLNLTIVSVRRVEKGDRDG